MADASTWSPDPWDTAFAQFRELGAWCSGNAAVLSEIYSGAKAAAAVPTHTVAGPKYRGTDHPGKGATRHAVVVPRSRKGCP